MANMSPPPPPPSSPEDPASTVSTRSSSPTNSDTSAKTVKYVPPHRRPGAEPPKPVKPSFAPSRPRYRMLRKTSNPRPGTLMHGLGKQIGLIPLADVPEADEATITDVTYAGSYKWIEGPKFTIAVPGLPDVWRGSELNVGQVCRDDQLEGNIVYTDYNGASVPIGVSAHEPVFLSLASPHLLEGVQVITGRTNLKRLLAACHPATGPGKARDNIWRIDAWTIPGSDLVLLDRWEGSAGKRPRQPQAYHLAYHEATTTKLQHGPDRTPGCHRLVRYSFGGFGVIVKCYDAATFPWSDEGIEDDLTNDDATSVISDLTDISRCPNSELSHVSEDSVVPRRVETSSGIIIQREALDAPPQEALICIKTRRWQGGCLDDVDHLDDIFSSALWGQTPHLIIGWHLNGDFSQGPPLKLRLGKGKLKELEHERRSGIAKVRFLLETMVNLVRKKDRVTFICDGRGISASELDLLPDDLSEEALRVLREAGRLEETKYGEDPWQGLNQFSKGPG